MSVRVLVFETPQYKLYVEKQVRNGLPSVAIKSVWPQARTDRSPHTLLNLNLPQSALDKIADIFKL